MFDPSDVLSMLDNKLLTLVSSLFVIVATLTTNIAANVVAPANGFSNISPKRISYKMGVLLAVIISVLYRPWWLFSEAGAYIFGWLDTYGGILAPIAAIFIADYYIIKKRNIDVMALFQGSEGRYWYTGGWNWKAVIAWVAGWILPTLGNFGVGALSWVAANGYFFGFGIGFAAYVVLMKGESASFISEEECEALTER